MRNAPPMSLLPALDTPRIERLRKRSPAHTADTLDALLAVVPADAGTEVFRQLPEPERWQELHARSKPSAGTTRHTVLANRRQTLAVLGYARREATSFEQLALAGGMLKDTGARNPETLGLISLERGAAATRSVEALLAAALAQAFALPAFRARGSDERSIRSITLLGGDPELDLPRATAAARGNNLARWLTALPPNKLRARAYRRLITDLARRNGFAMRWYDEAALRRLGANAFLAVSAGNDERVAGIAHLRYRPAKHRTRTPDVALIGKGILFDTGGVNLKPHKSMLDMHTDMAGSAVALGTLLALAELRAPLAIDAWLAITENCIGPSAYRPQDVVRAANGVTIQVVHTDAEGRMVLADTLALAGRAQPRLMIDFATLTGACVYALTERMSGVFTNRQALAGTLFEAGQVSGERVWNFPFEADYDKDLESKVADVVQCATDGKGDHILATRFLSRFVPRDTAWVHMDLSSATRSGGLGHVNTDVTGFGVRYTLELLLGQKVMDRLKDKP